MKQKIKGRKRREQHRHSSRRFDERYGLRFTQHLEDHLRRAVHTRGAILVRSPQVVNTRDSRVYDALYRIKPTECDDPARVGSMIIIRFVFDHKRNSVVTALERPNAG